MTRGITILVLLLGFISCKQQQALEKEDIASAPTTSEITKSDIEGIDYTEYGISPDVEEATANWIQYNDLKSYIEDLKKGDLSFFKGESQLISTLFNDLKQEIPSALKTNPINSRILVLETKTLKLNSILRLSTVGKEEQINNIKEMLIAMSHFNDQMNKKFEIENNNLMIDN